MTAMRILEDCPNEGYPNHGLDFEQGEISRLFALSFKLPESKFYQVLII